eukprot:gene5350-biopygen1684
MGAGIRLRQAYQVVVEHVPRRPVDSSDFPRLENSNVESSEMSAKNNNNNNNNNEVYFLRGILPTICPKKTSGGH